MQPLAESMTRKLQIALFCLLLPIHTISSACDDSSEDQELQNRLPKLELTPAHLEIRKSINGKPTSALDYYIKLPTSFFNGLDQSIDRRISFINIATIRNDYLEAKHYFECDGGGFIVEIQLYQTNNEPVVAIHRNKSVKIYDDGKPKEGDPSITVETPEFYKFSNGEWILVNHSILPDIDAKDILHQYFTNYDAHTRYTDQTKSIWLKYELTDSKQILVTGRENFMNPSSRNIWAKFIWTGTKEQFEYESPNEHMQSGAAEPRH